MPNRTSRLVRIFSIACGGKSVRKYILYIKILSWACRICIYYLFNISFTSRMTQTNRLNLEYVAYCVCTLQINEYLVKNNYIGLRLSNQRAYVRLHSTFNYYE